MNNRNLERDLDRAKDGLESVISSLVDEVERLENIIEQQASEIEDLQEKLKEYDQ